MITPDQYQTQADCIRSDQVPAAEVIVIMAENPDFARWYRARYLDPASSQPEDHFNGPASGNA
jgi:hypothetical protein